ncbi:hypothetical protein H4R35_006164 [Dimargaris xerosporica]|nr:hypothetical protein H4R35_006164 [Dimargaris xerosporica]
MPNSSTNGDNLQLVKLGEVINQHPTSLKTAGSMAQTLQSQEEAIISRLNALERHLANTEADGHPKVRGRLVEALRLAFGARNQGQIGRSRLTALRQTGTAAQYTETFNEVAGTISDLSDPEALHYYLMGLKGTLYRNLKIARLGTLQEHQRFALELEYGDQYRRGYHQRFTNHPGPRTTSGPIPMELDTVRRMTDEERNRHLREGRCFYYHEKGHRANQCQRKNQRSKPAQAHAQNHAAVAGNAPIPEVIQERRESSPNSQ